MESVGGDKTKRVNLTVNPPQSIQELIIIIQELLMLS